MTLPFPRVVTAHAVRPSDLDGAGHVNHARFVDHFEMGRWDWLRQNGLAVASSLVPVVFRLEVNYMRQLLWGAVNIFTEVQPPDDLDQAYRITAHQTLHAVGSTQPAASAVVSLAFVDARSGALCSVAEFLEVASANLFRETR